jgi:hypothetical protein
MPSKESADDSVTRTTAQFTTTHWSVVLAAGQSADAQAAEALHQLCRTYWYPLYAYVRKRGGGTTPLSLDVEAAEQRYTHEPAVTLTPERAYEK